MVSGAVAVPLVVPRQQFIEPGLPKGVIDTNTVVEMTCPNYEFAFIFYTTDGSKPTSRVSKTINTRTFKYKPEEGVLLRQGKRAIRAMCVLPDGRESNIVTKEFLVKWAPSESDEEYEDEEEIYRTIEESRASRQFSNRGNSTVTGFSSGFYPELNQTNRTMSGRRSVGGDVLVQRTTAARHSTTGLSVDFNQYSNSNPRVVNTVKMHATTGPIDQLKTNPLGERQFDLPPAPQLNGNLLRCTGCGRVNNPDARFCDWCGTIPGSRVTWETVPFPMKPTKNIQTPRKVASVVARNAQTQTVGLFYPGGKRVDTESHQALDQLVRQSTAVSLAKTVSATSPGNGKWKDQLDHINHHLKAYVQSNLEFRDMFAEPRLGVIESAKVVENDEDVDILMTFPIVDGARRPSKKTKVKKSVAFGATTAEPIKPNKNVKTKKPKDELPPEERILLSELGKRKCSLEKIEEVLIAGADPNCQDKDGLKPIAKAIINKHYEAAMLLLREKYLDFNWFAGEDQDTVLHLIVKSGESPESVKVLEKLLSRDIRQRENKEGLSPVELARDFGYSRMLQELRGEYSASLTSSARLNNQPASRVGKQVDSAANRSGGSRPSSSASSREKISVTKSQPSSSRDEKSNPPSGRSYATESDRPTSARSNASKTGTEKPTSSRSARSRTSDYSQFSTKSSILDEF